MPTVKKDPVAEENARLDEYVEIELFRDGDRYKDDVFVAVGGENCLIKRGEPVRVKRKFALALEQSRRQDIAAAAFIAACKGPARLADLGCDRAIIDKAAQDAVLNPMKLQSCPRPVSPDNAAEIISGILTAAW